MYIYIMNLPINFVILVRLISDISGMWGLSRSSHMTAPIALKIEETVLQVTIYE